MTNEVKNVPELRFAEFDGEWEEKNLEEISNKVTEKNRSNELSETFTNSAEYGIISQQDYFDKAISNEKNLSNYYIVKKDDFVYNPRISNFAPVGPIKRNKLNRSGLMSPLYYVFRTFNINMDYIGTYFETIYWHKFMKLNGDSGARSDRFAIKDSVFQTMPIPYPIIEEQQKIGEFFSKLDRQIELEEQKLAKLEEQKKGYMQKIFSQEMRFKDEKGNDYPEWDITTIEKIAKVSKGFTPSTKDINLWQNDNKNWLSIAGMSDKYIYEGNKGISSVGEGKHKKVNKDTLIMSFKLTLGKLAIVRTPIYTNEAICHFEWKTNQLKTEYMYYYLSFINIKSFGAQAVKGITLNNDSINSIVIKLPGFLEQNKISNFFTKFDELIEKQNQKIDGLKKRKKGFLQKMFV